MRIDQCYRAAEGRKHGGEFAADHTAAHDDQRRRQAADFQHRSRIQHPFPVEGYGRRPPRPGTGREHDHGSAELLPVTAGTGYAQGMGIGKTGLPRDQHYTLGHQPLEQLRLLAIDDAVLLTQRLAQKTGFARSTRLYRSAHTEACRARYQVGGFAERLAGNCARLQAHTADIGLAFDHGNTLAQPGGSESGLLPARA